MQGHQSVVGLRRGEYRTLRSSFTVPEKRVKGRSSVCRLVLQEGIRARERRYNAEIV